MSSEDSSISSEDEKRSSKHVKSKKRSADQAELEVDLTAPEPPSKKALRKAKKSVVPEVKGKNDQAVPESGAAVANKTSEDINNSGKRSEYGIWIGNLSFATTREELFDFMSSNSEHHIPRDKVTRVNMPSNRAKNGKMQNKGFAYVDLVDVECHRKALELSESLLGGRRVLIKDAKSFEGRPKEGAAPPNSRPPNKRIFLGNLAFETTSDDLEKHFGVCGPITNTQMATFEDSGKCKGYAWLEFENLSAAQAAMRGWVEEGARRIWLHNMAGRKLRLEYAEDKATRYQKRYGKNGTKTDGADTTRDVDNGVDGQTADNTSTKDESADWKQTRDRKPKRPRVRENGYKEETVTRLKGAIVESKGQRTTFE